MNVRIATIILIALTLLCGASGCATSPADNANIAPQRTEKLESVAAHSTENQPPPQIQTIPAANSAGPKTKWAQSGNPIDTRKFDEAIAKAGKDLKAKPTDTAAKKALAEGYFSRAFALTDARQYASALGDYRRVLKYDPSDEEAKTWIDQIIKIYDSMNKQYPKEGEEPPALTYKKVTNDEKR